MNSLKRTIKFLKNNTMSEFFGFVFGIIIMSIVSYVFLLVMNKNGSTASQIYGIMHEQTDGTYMHSIAGGNLLILLICFVTSSYTLYYNALPTAIGFSSTRKNFAISAFINSIIYAAIISIIQTSLFKLDIILVKNVGRIPIVDYKIFNISTDSFIYIFLLLFLLFLFTLGFLNLLASANYKFGYMMWIVIGLTLTLIMPLFGGKILTFISAITLKRINSTSLLVLITFPVVCYGLSGLITKNVNIKRKLSK